MSVYKCYKQDSMFGGVCFFSVHFLFNEVICIMSALLNLPTLRKTSEAEKKQHGGRAIYHRGFLNEC